MLLCVAYFCSSGKGSKKVCFMYVYKKKSLITETMNKKGRKTTSNSHTYLSFSLLHISFLLCIYYSHTCKLKYKEVDSESMMMSWHLQKLHRKKNCIFKLFSLIRLLHMQSKHPDVAPAHGEKKRPLLPYFVSLWVSDILASRCRSDTTWVITERKCKHQRGEN